MKFVDNRRACPAVLALAALVLPSSLPAQTSPEGLILETRLAQDFARQLLADVRIPLGVMLSQIGSSDSFATGRRGPGFWALTLGATALRFDVANPDYTLAQDGHPERLTGPAGSVSVDLELGLFGGYRIGNRGWNAGSLDLLLRLGATIGDQDDLGDKVDLTSIQPIYGVGARVGLLRGRGVPFVSVSAGVNRFTERHFVFQGVANEGTLEQVDFDLSLRMLGTSTFVIGEVGKDIGFLNLFVAGGFVKQRLETSYVSEVVYEAAPILVGESLDLTGTDGLGLAGTSFGGGAFRVVLDGGSLGGTPFGSIRFRFGGNVR